MKSLMNSAHGLLGWRSAMRLILLAATLSTAGSAMAQSPPTIAKSFSTATVPKNQNVTLTFTITNPNPAIDLTGISFNDNLPAGLIIANPDSLTPDPVLGDCDPTGTTGAITLMVNSVSLTGGQIPANATCTFSIDVLAVSVGDQVNTTDPITSTEGGTGGTATATVSVLPSDLTIAKTHGGNFRQGQVGATYTITVTNSGAADTDAPVTVTDILPSGLVATNIGGSGWQCSAPPTLACTQVAGLTAGTSFPALTVTVNVAANAAPTLLNTATVAGGGEIDTSNDTATDATTVDQVADLVITKTHSGSFSPGQVGATFTLTVSNVGPGPTLGAVSVTDTLPNSPNTFVPTAMSGSGWTCNLATLSCTRSDVLIAGGSYPAITLTVNVPNNIPPNVNNTASVSGGGELNTANDTASDLTHTGPPLVFTVGNPNLQVTAGGETSTTFTLDSSSGLGPVTFACSGLPAGGTCAFSPASTAQITTSVMMTVTTTLGAAELLPQVPGELSTPPFYATAFVAGLVLLLFIRFTGKGTKAALPAFAIAGLALLLGLSACSGISATPRAGNFTLTVTATSSSGPSASTKMNLTVLQPGPVH